MQKIKCRTAYNARDEEHEGLIFAEDEGMTQQHFKDECDVNLIIKRYVQTGVMEHTSNSEPWFGDVSDVPTNLAESYESLARAEAAFMALPAEIRKSLDNDPAKLETWLSEPENRFKAEEFGLIKKSVIENVVPNNDNKVPEKADSTEKA